MNLIDKNINKTLAAEPRRRRRRRPAAARDNVLIAAEAMLIADGPQSLKLTQVARAAGVSNATVLHHFGSIAGVQTALMERMVRALVDEVLAISIQDPANTPPTGQGLIALFDAFETRGAGRLTAWLELAGEAGRLTVIRDAVREVVAVRAAQFTRVPPQALEDFLLACIAMALAVGLFGPTLSELLGRPSGRAREVALALLFARLRDAFTAV